MGKQGRILGQTGRQTGGQAGEQAKKQTTMCTGEQTGADTEQTERQTDRQTVPGAVPLVRFSIMRNSATAPSLTRFLQVPKYLGRKGWKAATWIPSSHKQISLSLKR